MKSSASVFALMVSLLSLASAQAQTREVVGTSMGFAIYDTIRNHPVATVIAVLVAIAVLAAVVLWVVRRVKAEARGYYMSGKKTWSGVRQRFEENPFARRFRHEDSGDADVIDISRQKHPDVSSSAPSSGTPTPPPSPYDRERRKTG